MLLYHPATDFYHCWMRFAAILTDSEPESVEWDRLRILDYMLCFPHELEQVPLPKDVSAPLKNILRRLPHGYEETNSVRNAFQPMTRIHGQVALDMASRGVVQRNRFREGIVVPTPGHTGVGLLKDAARHWGTRNDEWYGLALTTLMKLPLSGPDGLKDRTRLLEYRYD